MRVDKIIDLVIISHRDTCPFLSRDGDKMCKHLKDCDMDCDYMSSFIENEDDIIYVINSISSILYEPIDISNTDKKMLEIGIALGLKGAISCIFGSLSKDDCNIKDEIIDISKHIKEKLISDNHG